MVPVSYTFQEPASGNHDKIPEVYISSVHSDCRIHICHFPDHRQQSGQPDAQYSESAAPWKHYPPPSADAVRSLPLSLWYHAERSWHILNPLFRHVWPHCGPIVLLHSEWYGTLKPIRFPDPSAFLQYNHGRKKRIPPSYLSPQHRNPQNDGSVHPMYDSVQRLSSGTVQP